MDARSVLLTLGLLGWVALESGNIQAMERIGEDGSATSYMLTEKDRNAEVRIHVQDTITLRLESIPGTGYEWKLVELGEELERCGHCVPEGREDAAGPILGAPEYLVCRFRAVSAGTGQLQLEYRRLWETVEKPAKVFAVTVVVDKKMRIEVKS